CLRAESARRDHGLAGARVAERRRARPGLRRIRLRRDGVLHGAVQPGAGGPAGQPGAVLVGLSFSAISFVSVTLETLPNGESGTSSIRWRRWGSWNFAMAASARCCTISGKLTR